MKHFLMVIAVLLFLTGCSAFIPFFGAKETPTPDTPDTAAPAVTTEVVPEEDTTPPGYHHSALAGTWVRTGSQVEGDTNDGGNCTVVITAVGDGTYRITYTDQNFPDSNYADKAVQILEQPLYEGCGNDRWMGTVDHISQPNITHALTIRGDAVLILQNSFSFDGMPMVSYEFFERVP